MERQEDRAEWYRRKAEETLRAAERPKEPAMKNAFEDLARSWLDLAKRGERAT